MGLETLQNDVYKVCQSLGLSERLSMVERAWDAEMGQWSTMIKLVAIDKGALVIEASSSAAMQEVSLRRRELVRRLNRHMGQPVIETILVKVARG